MSVELELATHLVARLAVLNAGGGSGLFAGIGTFTLGKNVRIGPVEPASDVQTATNAVPHECIFVMGFGGRKPIHLKGGGTERFPGCQFWVRSRVKGYASGKKLADAVVEAVDAQPPAASSLNFYELRTLSSEPDFMQEDDAGHMEWTVNAEARRCL